MLFDHNELQLQIIRKEKRNSADRPAECLQLGREGEHGFNSGKFDWVRYVFDKASSLHFQYISPDQTAIEQKDSLHDLHDLTFALQIEKVVATASQLVGWGMREFKENYLLLTLFKSIVQPHSDYNSQL